MTATNQSLRPWVARWWRGSRGDLGADRAGEEQPCHQLAASPLAGGALGAEFDSQHAEDDEHDPADHDRGERFTVDQGGQDRGEGDAGGSPDAVGDAERHALAQDEREEHERAEETGDHERIPAR